MTDTINNNKLNYKYPRVLIIGEGLHNKTGTGITLSNFFADWPKDNLAVLAGDTIWESNVEKCNNYYLWKTTSRFIPKSLIRFSIKINNRLQEGSVSVDDILRKQKNEKDIRKGNLHISMRNFLIHIFKYIFKLFRPSFIFLIKFIGVLPLLKNEINITSLLNNWLTSYKPEVIYTFLNKYDQFQFVLDLHNKYKTPYIVHIGDDHINLMPPKGLLYYYWRDKMNSKYLTLLSNASVRLSICDYMSQIYKQRYKLDFFAYHNPIEPEKWRPYLRNNWECKGKFKILFTGRYDFSNSSLLHTLAQVIEEVNIEGFSVILDIRFGVILNKKGVESFKKYKHTKLKKYIPHNKITSLLPTYDLLYIPLGFDNKTKLLYSVSMSTKISEYMISGTPNLVQAPEDTAYFQYAKNGMWAYLLKTDKKNDLKDAILELIQNEALRGKLGDQAKKIAFQNHDAKTVRKNFQLEFIKAITK